MSDLNPKTGVPMGFSGILQLVSHVQVDDVAAGQAPQTRKQEAEHRTAAAPLNETPSAERKSSDRQLLWIVAIVAVFFAALGFIGNKREDKAKASSPAVIQPTEQPTSSGSSVPVESPASITQRETLPPVGQDHVLSVPQIRYCVSEDIRMGGAESVLDLSNEAQVNAFNAMVDDYNSRCSSYRYRAGSLEQVQREIEVKRELLRAEGAMQLHSRAAVP